MVRVSPSNATGSLRHSAYDYRHTTRRPQHTVLNRSPWAAAEPATDETSSGVGTNTQPGALVAADVYSTLLENGAFAVN
jgi:hypothetical protein